MQIKSIAFVLVTAAQSFATPISYHCTLMERVAGQHGIIASHGEGTIKISDLGQPNSPGITLKGPHDTEAYMGGYKVNVPSKDYQGRVGSRKLLLALSEKDSTGYPIFYQELVLSVDDGATQKATLHRDLDKSFLRIECAQVPK